MALLPKREKRKNPLMKYFIVTFGCQMNYSDSERIANVLEQMKLKPAKNIQQAGIVVMNMCSVRQSAVNRIWGLNEKIKKDKVTSILTGCILPKDKRKFEDKFDYVLDIKTLSNWPKILKNLNVQKCDDYLEIEPKRSSKFSASIPIMTGCNNFCSYCAVPYTRGREVSRKRQDIIKEIKELLKNDYKEIWLLGQNVNSYKYDFPNLLKKINKIPGNFWIRFSSSHPKDFSNDLIEVIAECKKITPYIHLPVQSGNDKILQKMNRPYTIKKYKGLIKRIKKIIPDIAISTDVIVGFPGETKKQFQDTKKLFKEIKYDMAYINRYSPRKGTKAFELKDNVTPKEKAEREAELTDILKKTALKNNKKYINKTIDVLVKNYKNKFLFGKSFHYKTVKFPGSKKMIGRFVKVKITSVLPFSLNGEYVK